MITRRTLQEYDRIGLLSPTNKETRSSANETWLYSDADVWKLIRIQLFIAAGWKRNEIKGMLAAPDFDIAQALQQSLEKLQLEKARITRLIKNIAYISKYISERPVPPADPGTLFQNECFNALICNVDLTDCGFTKQFDFTA